VVRVNMRVATAGKRQVKASVPREKREHVVQKSDAGVDAAVSFSIDVQREADIRFGRLSPDFTCAHIT
jgi:hypothetical protein